MEAAAEVWTETAAEESPTGLPAPSELARGVLGFVALGAAVALGSGDAQGAALHGPTALLVDAGSLVLTGPALLVGHQFLDLGAPVTRLADDLLRAFVRSGGMALGLAPVFLYFSATSGLSPALMALALPAIGALGLAHAAVGLVASERDAAADHAVARLAKMRLLVSGWILLTVLVGARIAARVVLG
ncbi:MAG: hypothetical protein KC656_04440 [Myxococcales bacterium]|nr:hypothetical protein [Myxococcales bacterium]MCB9668575.1 hypothetical protein [Alphaproteobacteria bacterium]MCB9690816.1 hypothetical protein [Alphaproteobacteria bacterium]